MTFPQFSQKHIFRGSSLLLLRQHGLYVSQRRRNGTPWLETEIPYEELLPVGLEFEAPAPVRLPPSWLWLLVWFGFQGVSRLVTDKAGAPVPPEMWAAGLGFVLGLVGLWLARRYFGRTATLATNRIRLSLHDRPGQRAALDTFTEALRLRAHAYLRQEYAQVNPLGPIELQLHRLHWLHNLDVLSEPELRILSTRLTGRPSLEPLKLMGMDLETPYLN
ncbi:hypothetical protein [Hymenobacter psychrophilus]|uniref:Uncharacterized protein n=1 Tax=Hymenobacter psychrophilus TaxID=651662 RepID=A0A1H3DPY3_9BACT|nr:hypothetical protein [Hymenobacter psychrophilus]SDX68431.1 hypothetical protein SAMN04488069_102445 [Hymenobacter psychrophilus]